MKIGDPCPYTTPYRLYQVSCLLKTTSTTTTKKKHRECDRGKGSGINIYMYIYAYTIFMIEHSRWVTKSSFRRESPTSLSDFLLFFFSSGDGDGGYGKKIIVVQVISIHPNSPMDGPMLHPMCNVVSDQPVIGSLAR